MTDDGSSFWNFSLRFYAQPQVAAACLELQDQAGADVNVVLYLLYLAQHGRQLGRADVARIDALVSAWRIEVVQPLRTLRRRLKGGIAPIDAAASTALRDEIKRVELESERIEQITLESKAPAAEIGTLAASRITAAHANLVAYGELLGSLPAAAVNVLLEACAE
jgi:uncharacterized protein (TIGR02444 family)